MAIQPGSFPASPPTFPGPYSHSAELPLGVWNVLANGRIYVLDIQKVAGSEVLATFSSGDIGTASWDASKGLLSFTRITSITQRYDGYLSQFDRADELWRIAGVFGDVTVGVQAGWYATRPR